MERRHVMVALDARLGLSGHAFQGWRPEQLLETVSRRFGLTGLDYWPWNRGELGTDAYRDLLARYGVEVYVVNVPSSRGRLCSPGSEDKGRGALLDAIDEAAAVGASFVQFYTGVPDRPDFLTTVKLLARQLAPAVEKAERTGVTLLFENNLDQGGEDMNRLNPSRLPELVLATMEAVGSPRLRVCFDPCNFYAVGSESYPYAYELLRPYIATIHVKDCCRYSPLLHAELPNCDHLLVDSSAGAFLPVPVGSGALNWPGLFRRLADDGYQGWMTLDPFSSQGALVGWCQASLDYLREQVQFK